MHFYKKGGVRRRPQKSSLPFRLFGNHISVVLTECRYLSSGKSILKDKELVELLVIGVCEVTVSVVTDMRSEAVRTVVADIFPAAESVIDGKRLYLLEVEVYLYEGGAVCSMAIYNDRDVYPAVELNELGE